MAKIVSEKIWLKVGRHELEDLLAELLPDDICQTELVEAQVQRTSGQHYVDEITFGFKYKLYSREPIPCPDCGDEFSSEDALQDHYDLVHGPLRDGPSGPCPDCGSPDPEEVHAGDCSMGGIHS